MKATEYITKKHFNLWYGLFKKSKGWLLCNPLDFGDKVYVQYAFDDIHSANELNENYMRLTTPITETRRGFWKRIRAILKL